MKKTNDLGTKIRSYKTVSGASAADLDKEVNAAIAAGYQPYGNPFLSDRHVEGRLGDFVIFQAMVLAEERH